MNKKRGQYRNCAALATGLSLFKGVVDELVPRPLLDKFLEFPLLEWLQFSLTFFSHQEVERMSSYRWDSLAYIIWVCMLEFGRIEIT